MTQPIDKPEISGNKAIVLFGHGSRDPLWRQPMDAVAARIRALDPQANVVCAFLELTLPDIQTAVGELIQGGASRITVVPVFLGLGRHAREDLPTLEADLRRSHPDVVFDVLPTVGDDPRVTQLLAEIALG